MPAKAKKIAARKRISADDFMLEFNRLAAKHFSKTPQDQELRRANEVFNNFTDSSGGSRKKVPTVKRSRKSAS